MKRFISLLLCMVMSISFFSATVTEAFALGKAKDIFTVEKTEFKNDRITYTISLAPNQTDLVGAVIKAEYDGAVLKPLADSGAACVVKSGERVPIVTGYYESGINYNNSNAFSVAFYNINGVSIGAEGAKFMEITFEAVGKNRPVTEVKFYCEQYITEDGDKTNDITVRDEKQFFYEDSFFCLAEAKNVEVASYDGGLRFIWREAPGAEWYNIYRKVAGGKWEKLVDKYPADKTEYIDKTIERGIEYFYSVESANEYGVVEYDKTGVAGFDFGTITAVDAEITERGAKIFWSPLDSAKSYTVYRQAEGEETWKAIAETAEAICYDDPLTSGIEYSYTVKAHHEKGYTADATDEPAKIKFIANARIIEYVLNKKDIVINWRDVEGAVGYEIYRKATGEKAFKYVATVEMPGYTDTDVVDGKEYFYKVRSLGNLTTKEGSVLGDASFDLVKLPLATNVKAALGGDNIKVTWDAVALAEEYIVYRQNNQNGSWFESGTVKAPATEFIDRGNLKNGKTYSYAISTKADGMVTSISDPSSPICYVVGPTITDVKNNYPKGIELAFTKVEGVTSYNIYRKTVNGQFAKIATVSSAASTTYLDTTAVSGCNYIYGVQSVYDNATSGITASQEVCFLSEPQFTVKNAYGGLELNWNAVPGAEKYIIYYGGTFRDLSKMDAIDEVTTTKYVYKNGESAKNNWFAVVAVCGETVSTKTAKSAYYFEAPRVELIENMSNGIKVRWNKVLGATSYVLLRKAGSAKNWEKVAVVNEDEAYPYVQYTDKNVKSGTAYTYTVKAYDDDEYSPYNETGWKLEYLSTPKISSIDNCYGGPKITWGKVTGAKKYEVYRKTKSSDWNSIASTSSASYIDSSAKDGTKYYYAVRAVDGKTKSYYSNDHFNDVCKTVTYNAVVKLENTTSTDIKISWNKVSGAKKYEVYRKAGSAKKWTKLKTTTSTSYTDTGTKHGTTYKYMVKAIDSKSKVVSSSDSATIRCISAPKLSSVKSAKSGITFKWKKVSGVKGYYIYRKTGSGDYEKIATVKGAGKVSYVDKKAKKGKTYTYTVKAYYGSYSSAYRSGLKIKDKY